MKTKEILSEHRNDFSATMECEHCGSTHKLTSGYHDNYYHTVVIPAMKCTSCGKNRDGVQ
jgi:C4-type Zn-finger protein